MRGRVIGFRDDGIGPKNGRDYGIGPKNTRDYGIDKRVGIEISHKRTSGYGILPKKRPGSRD